MLMWVELTILLLCILIGARLGGISLGTVSGIGLLVFVFVFRMPPGGPPGTVLGMIIAVITAVSAMQAAGGLDFLVAVAARFLRRRPRQVTVLAPAITYALVFAAGTQHVLYALLPVIAEVSRQAGIRPERPLSASVVASQCGVIASPIAAATVALTGLLAGGPIGLPQILMVTVPATIVGATLATLSVAFRGKEPRRRRVSATAGGGHHRSGGAAVGAYGCRAASRARFLSRVPRSHCRRRCHRPLSGRTPVLRDRRRGHYGNRSGGDGPADHDRHAGGRWCYHNRLQGQP